LWLDVTRDGKADWLTVDFTSHRLLLFRQVNGKRFAKAEIYYVPEAPLDMLAMPRAPFGVISAKAGMTILR